MNLTQSPSAARAELIVALDVSTQHAAHTLLAALPPEVHYVKVGLELFISEGPRILELVRACGKQCFLDLKLHDIPHTVARAVQAAAQHNVFMLTLHAQGGAAMLQAAATAAAVCGAARPHLVAVTTLTSLDQGDLAQLGILRPLPEHTLALGKLAMACGLDGLVCSPLELAACRRDLGAKPLLVTPGIRPANSASDDQKRVATPAAAIRAGASFLVVGRPISEAADPRAAAAAILQEMRKA